MSKQSICHIMAEVNWRNKVHHGVSLIDGKEKFPVRWEGAKWKDVTGKYSPKKIGYLMGRGIVTWKSLEA